MMLDPVHIPDIGHLPSFINIQLSNKHQKTTHGYVTIVLLNSFQAKLEM